MCSIQAYGWRRYSIPKIDRREVTLGHTSGTHREFPSVGFVDQFQRPVTCIFTPLQCTQLKPVVIGRKPLEKGTCFSHRLVGISLACLVPMVAFAMNS
jgi:hypothetical protein